MPLATMAADSGIVTPQLEAADFLRCLTEGLIAVAKLVKEAVIVAKYLIVMDLTSRNFRAVRKNINLCNVSHYSTYLIYFSPYSFRNK